MAESKIVKVNEKIATTVTDGFHKIEGGAVGAYKKVEDKFVSSFLTHEGESVEEAKERLKAEQAAAGTAAADAAAITQASVDASREIGGLSIEASKKLGKH